MRRPVQAAGAALLLVVSFLGTPGKAAESPRLRFTRAAEMPDSGIRVLLPAESVPDPLPPPAVLDGFREQGGRRERIVAQSPLELWRWRQYEGRWTDGQGNRLVLAAVTMAPAETFPEWLERDAVPGFLSGLSASGRNWAREDLVQWFERFTGSAGPAFEAVTRGLPFALGDAYLIQGTAGTRRLAGAAFRLKSGPETWRFALVELAPGVDAAAAARALREDFLPSIQYLGKRAAVRASPAQGGPGGGPLSPRDESARRARESIRNLKGWWSEEGKHTIVLSNIRSGKTQLVSAILEDLEALRPSWEALVPPWQPSREVAVIRVFGTAEEYVRYVGPDKAWTGGLYVPVQRELVIRPLDEGSVMKNRRAVLATVYHEAFHQYLDEAFDRVQAAPWFNEGHAALFASLDITGRGVRFEKEPRAAAVLARLAGEGQADPRRILSLDYPDFYGRDNETREAHYALAWGLVYFLQADPTDKKRAAWRPIPARYAAALKETRDPVQATDKAFEGVDREAFAKAFQAYWR